MSIFPNELSNGPSTFTDAQAAERLVNLLCRQIAEVMDAGDACYAKDLMPIYQWLNAQIADDLAAQQKGT